MAAEWLQSDVHGLIRLAILVDHFYLRETPALHAEIRQQEARFGLSSMDRRRLQWEIQKAEGHQPVAKPAPPLPADYEPAGDPRLRALK